MNAKELLRAGQLAAAIDASVEEVKRRPTDLDAREFLCELLILGGDLERADKHMDVLGHQNPQFMVGVALLRQLVRAEQARQQLFSEGRVPEFLEEPDAGMRAALQASVLLREGDAEQAKRIMDEAEENRAPLVGYVNGNKVDDFRDLDDLLSGVLELLTSNGKYYWIPFKRIKQLEFRPAERTLDLLWRRAHIEVDKDGPSGEVYIPATYVPLDGAVSDEARLGRTTDWVGGEESMTRGIGLRMFLAGEEALPIMDIQELRFSGADEL
jgi:type VI secretion system protein ImpE